MANNYLQFSEQIDNLTADEVNWFDKELEYYHCEYGCGFKTKEDLDDCPTCNGFMSSLLNNCRQEEDAIWFFADEGGNVDLVANLVQRFLKAFRPKESFGLSWSETCSKLRIGEFGGGAVFVTADDIKYQSSGTFLYDEKRKFEQRG